MYALHPLKSLLKCFQRFSNHHSTNIIRDKNHVKGLQQFFASIGQSKYFFILRPLHTLKVYISFSACAIRGHWISTPWVIWGCSKVGVSCSWEASKTSVWGRVHSWIISPWGPKGCPIQCCRICWVVSCCLTESSCSCTGAKIRTLQIKMLL